MGLSPRISSAPRRGWPVARSRVTKSTSNAGTAGSARGISGVQLDLRVDFVSLRPTCHPRHPQNSEQAPSATEVDAASLLVAGIGVCVTAPRISFRAARKLRSSCGMSVSRGAIEDGASHSRPFVVADASPTPAL